MKKTATSQVAPPAEEITEMREHVTKQFRIVRNQQLLRDRLRHGSRMDLAELDLKMINTRFELSRRYLELSQLLRDSGDDAGALLYATRYGRQAFIARRLNASYFG